MYIRKPYPNELYHYGIQGQRWGVRRFQNPDGSLTPAGRKRYANLSAVPPSAAVNTVKSTMSAMLKNPLAEMTRQADAYNSLSRDEQLDLLRQDPATVRKHYANIEKARRAAYADEAINSLKKIGFSDDTKSNPKDHWLSKNIKTKHGDITFFTNIDTTETGLNGGTGTSPITEADVRAAVSGINKYGRNVMSRLNKEEQPKIKNGYYGSPDAKLGNIDSVYMVKFNDIGSLICEVTVPLKVKSSDETFGWLSAEMDPRTGKIANISYND